MATVKIWSIKSNLNRLLEYAKNKEKTLFEETLTEKETDEKLSTVLQYAANQLKTEQKLFVTGINCNEENVTEEMMNTKKLFHKTDGILAFHAYQSFAPGEGPPELVHKIGVEFAKKMWGEKFEVIVATHLNTNCLHNHFVLNSVSFVDGKKYNACRQSYKLMREVSDKLCREYGLSVILDPQPSKRQSYAEYMDDKNNPLSKNNIFRRDIDECIAMSVTRSDFLRYMKERGYYLDFSHKYATISHEYFPKPRRLRNLGEQYTPDAIKERIKNNWSARRPEIPEQDDLINENLVDYDESSYKNVYVHYVTIVTKVKSRPDNNRAYQIALSEEIRKLDRLIEQQNFLCDRNIDTKEQLAEYKEILLKEKKELEDARYKLRINLIQFTRKGDEENINRTKEHIATLSGRLKELRRDISICERIENNEPEIKEKISELKNINERKEKTRDGYVRRRSREDR